MSKLRSFRDAIVQFHRDEDGEQVLSTVLVLAVAAIIGMLVKSMGQGWQTKASSLGDSVIGK